MTLGENLRAARGSAAIEDSGSLQHFERPGAVRQPADEAALLERRDQPMDAGLGAQIERVLHLVEGGRNAGFLEPLVDEAQKLALFLGQHWLCLGSRPRATQVSAADSRPSLNKS